MKIFLLVGRVCQGEGTFKQQRRKTGRKRQRFGTRSQRQPDRGGEKKVGEKCSKAEQSKHQASRSAPLIEWEGCGMEFLGGDK